MIFKGISDFLISKKSKAVFWLVLMSSAFFLRIPNLGHLGLWGDEGFTAIAVAAILEHGYPLLPSGGIYPRALAFSYLEAFSAKIFGLNEFALRFPNTIYGLAGIWMTYILGKSLYGTRVGYLAAILMTFSIWEITFSRYARMYVFFQFFYLVSIYFFYRGFIKGERFYRWLTAPLWMLTITIHQLGLSLAPLLMVPFFIKGYSHVRKWTLFCGFFGVGLFWKLYTSFQSSLRPNFVLAADAGKKVASKSPIAVPPLDLLLRVVEGGPLLFYIFIGIVVLSGSFFVFKSFSEPDQRMQYLSLVLIVLSCFFNQIGLAFVLLVFYSLMFFNRTNSWRQRPFLMACAIIFSSLLSWVTYAIYHDFTARKLISLLFQYPYLHERFLRFFVPGWPLVTFLSGLGLLLSWYYFINDNRKHVLLVGFASLVGPLLLVGIAYRQDDEARYSFHLYPLMLILSAYGLVQLLTWFVHHKRLDFAIALLVLCIFFIPGDFQFFYAASISQNEYGKKINQPIKTPGYYTFHPDYKTPSYYIKNNRSEGDLVISMLEAIPIYYVGQIDYLWIPTDNDNASMHRYGFTGKLLRIRFSEFEKLLKENSGTHFWLFEDPIPASKLTVNTSILEFMEAVSLCQVFGGKDEKTVVYHFYPNEVGQPVCINP